MPHDNDNENTTAVIDAEAPAAEKPEKPKRAPRKKAAPVEEAPETNGAPALAGEPTAQASAPSVAAEEEAPAPPAPQPSHRPQQQQAAETIDIRVLKEMKLPDLSKLARELGVEN